MLLVGVYAPNNKSISQQDHYDEFLSLVKTLGSEYVETHFIKLRSIDKARFLTKGKLHEVIELCQKLNIEEVMFSDNLSPMQERNMEDLIGCKVYGRQQLILEIFKQAAHTAEGKIQIEMAELDFFKTRIAGKGIDLAQQAGYVGTRGPGESQKEYITRFLNEKVRQARKRLKTLQRTREIQRKHRLGTKIPLICLVGYTNSGKSTILNTLTKSSILAEDKLFATVDTTTRELYLNKTKIGLISDTVGFISQLPHHLIEAFKSTLDELNYAHLLLHVVDISNHAWKNQITVVQETLESLGVSDKKTLYVFNKVDKIPEEEKVELLEQLEVFQPHVVTHAKSKDGLSELIEYLIASKL